MTNTTPTTSASSATDREALAEPSERGRTVIADAVVQRIAARAAADVDGVTPAGSGLDKLVGRRYPKADAQIAGGRSRLHIEIAVAWPHPLGDVCGRVRDTVATRVTELTGLDVDTVDVTAATVIHIEPVTPTRRVA